MKNTFLLLAILSMLTANAAMAATATDLTLGAATVTGSVLGQPSTALGNGSNVTGSYVTAVGASSVVTGNGSTAVGTFVGITPGTGINNTAIGYQATINTIGANVTNSVVIGNNASIQNYAAGTTITNSTVIGSGAISAGSNTVSFGNGTVNAVISNISNGVNSSDAATVGQLNAALAGVTGGGATVASVTAAQSTADIALSTANTADSKATAAISTANAADSKATAALSTANNAQTTATTALDRVDSVARGVAASMSMNAASSNASLAASKGVHGFGIGIGTSDFAGNHSNALSVAYNYKRVTFNASSSIGGTDASTQVGFGLAF